MPAETAASPLRMLYQGLAIACAAGLVAGAAMKPSLREIDGPAGPQMLAGVSGDRVYSYGYTATDFAARPGPPPDYVVGTDWLRPPMDPQPVAYMPPEPAYDEAYEDLPPIAYAAPAPYELADLEPPPPPRIPSLDGDVLGGRAPPPTPIAETVAFEPPA